MKFKFTTAIILAFIVFASFTACENSSNANHSTQSKIAQNPDTTTHYPQEKHLANIRQLTFDGENAEAYFSFDDSKIVFQAKNEAWGSHCDQIFYFRFAAGNMKNTIPPLLSNGLGRTTCAYFLPGDTTILYASTRAGGDSCPPEPKHRSDGKYVWPIYEDFDIYEANLKGELIDTLIKNPGYDAEATVSAQGDKIVFTSDRSGDLELYTCDMDGSNIHQVTNQLGYDGGAFFSPDGTKLVFRSSRPKTPEEIKTYKDLLKQHLVMPTKMEIYTCNVDGSGLTQVTHLGKANWAPFFSHDGKHIIFSSNFAGTRGFDFNLYMVNLDGSGLQRITYDSVFDAFPMFSYDGKKLIFSSSRNNRNQHGINLFIADWVE